MSASTELWPRDVINVRLRNVSFLYETPHAVFEVVREVCLTGDVKLHGVAYSALCVATRVLLIRGHQEDLSSWHRLLLDVCGIMRHLSIDAHVEDYASRITALADLVKISVDFHGIHDHLGDRLSYPGKRDILDYLEGRADKTTRIADILADTSLSEINVLQVLKVLSVRRIVRVRGFGPEAVVSLP